MNAPAVSVLLPVYNSEHYLIDAVGSILQQTYTNWEMLCINDGSTDSSGELLDWFAQQDPRVRVYHQANQGLVGALNRGIELAQGQFIARMDNDDVAAPNRLAQQVAAMRANPDCVVCGTAIIEVDSDGAPLNRSELPNDHEAILNNLLHRQTGHFHPTTMIKRSAVVDVGGYRPQYEWIEDHDLWLRLSQVGRLMNLSEAMLFYRLHETSICWQRSEQRRQLMDELLREAYHSRNLQMPETLLMENSTKRASAGPGKWARTAARGGFFQTTLKHLRRLNRSPAKWTYKLRMNAECALRLTAHALKGKSDSQVSGAQEYPAFDSWHERWKAAA